MDAFKNSSTFITITFLTILTLIFNPNPTSSQYVSETTVTTSTAPPEKITRLQFYFHDVISGTKPTAKKIIGTNAFGFGSPTIIDDKLTEGPELTSKSLGKAQGIYAVASQTDVSFLMVVNFEFTSGKYNGSSISLQGRNHVIDNVREMPIVGGTGLFRFGRGYALAHTVWFDFKTGDATVKYDVVIKF